MRHRHWALSLAALLALAGLLTPGSVARAQVGVEARFAAYYREHDGMRLLGYPLTPLQEVEGFPAQYFDKGRLEDHRGEVDDPSWQLMFGRLTAELLARPYYLAVSGTNLTYGALREAGRPEARLAPPAGFGGGVLEVERPLTGRAVFIPVDPALRPAPGYEVPLAFWSYMNRRELFPGGWLHDVGLPLSPPLSAEAYKGGGRRTIVLQAFERTVLTLDPLNPPGWEVERGNLGADMLAVVDPAPGQLIGSPELGANVALPLHLDARLGAPGDQVVARLRWADGTELTQRLTLLRGEDGGGLLVGNLDWENMLAPPRPPTQPALLEVRTMGGALLARRGVTVLAPGDAAARTVQIFWTISGTELTGPQERQVVLDPGRPRPGHYWALSEAERLAAGALEELLWGPPAISQIGYRSAIPTPAEVLAHPGRGADWGHRVALRSLRIVDGLATADFSAALAAHDGSALRTRLIREQITRTLRQFPEVSAVRILVEGRPMRN